MNNILVVLEIVMYVVQLHLEEATKPSTGYHWLIVVKGALCRYTDVCTLALLTVSS